MAATAAALARSETTLVVRNPSLSTTTPPKNAASTVGRKLKNTASPVSAGLPVVTRTNHGTASCVTAFPVSEIASPAYSATRGIRLRSGIACGERLGDRSRLPEGPPRQEVDAARGRRRRNHHEEHAVVDHRDEGGA